ncbi:MAG: HesA/MoeB/ThiF family protein, partial [Chlamydiota bacterium]
MSDYSRQMILPEVGQKGQELLKNGKCLVIGAGGLGAPALLYLAAAGVGTLGICDGDILEKSNLHRQPLYLNKEIGKPKAEIAAARLRELNPSITVDSYPNHCSAKNALYLFSLYDIVLDCTDNFRAKFLINDAAYFLQKPVIRASIYQFEGQIQTYLPERGDACLRCLWEETPQEGCVGTCQQVGVLGPVPGYFGILQAMEAIKFFLKMPVLGSHEILFNDLIHYTQRTISFERKKNCPLCGAHPTILHLSERESWEIEFAESKKMTLIDIREL